MPFLDSHQDASVTYPARLHGRGILKKPLFATRRLHGYLAPPESLVSIFDPAPSHTAHPPSPFPPNEKPFLDSHQDASVTYPARLHGRGILKNPLFATRRLHGHLAPPESLVSIFDPAPSHTAHPPSPFPPNEKPFLDSHQDASVTYPARLHGRGILKKPLFATRRLHGYLAPPESLVSIFDPAPSHTAHPPSPFPPNEKPSFDSHQDASVTYPARLHGRGILKNPLFATRRLHGHLAPPESLVSIFDPAPSHTAHHPPSPFPPNEKPSFDSHQDASVTYPARLHGRGILKNPLFATRRLHGHLAPLEPLAALSEANTRFLATSPLAASLQVLDLELRL